MNNCGNNIVYSVKAYTNITNAWNLCTKEAFQEVIRHVFQEVVPPPCFFPVPVTERFTF